MRIFWFNAKNGLDVDRIGNSDCKLMNLFRVTN